MVEGPLKPPSLPLPSRPCEDVVEFEGDDEGREAEEDTAIVLYVGVEVVTGEL